MSEIKVCLELTRAQVRSLIGWAVVSGGCEDWAARPALQEAITKHLGTPGFEWEVMASDEQMKKVDASVDYLCMLEGFARVP